MSKQSSRRSRNRGFDEPRRGSDGTRRRRAGTIAAVFVVVLLVVGGAAALAVPQSPAATDTPPVPSNPIDIGLASPNDQFPTIGPSLEPTAVTTPGPTFDTINLFATPSPPPAGGGQPTDPAFAVDPRRPLPVQTNDWLNMKAAGRIALVAGKIAVLDPNVSPMTNPFTGAVLPSAFTLETSWTRWVVEPTGSGTDEKGNRYSDLSYWNLCGPGASTVALYYWQQLTGHPDVTGTAGYFLDPYAGEGVSWPSPGPSVASSGTTRLGTYWSGSDRIGGFSAHGRGFILYMATVTQPPGWQSPGIAVFANSNGAALYPTRGAPRTNIQAGLNWEISGHAEETWATAWYASVIRPDPTLAQDLQSAVTLDVGRDGVPVIAALDTFDLPNWQDGAATPHTRHAVAIVGYDNAASPPTYTYIDTCGRSCNNRGGNQNGQLHVIAQSRMVLAIQDKVGSGFVW
jgi:hypothetical protein